VKNKGKIVIIGAGFSGLSAAYWLNRAGYKVKVVEAKSQAGGLGAGFKLNNWDWRLEYFYHHLFASDKKVFDLIRRMGLSDKVVFKRPVTGLWIKDKTIRFDSPLDVVRYPFLGWGEKMRLGAGVAFLKLWPFGVRLERFRANQALPILLGSHGYQQIFKPLLSAKFGKWADKVNLAWFWARIKARTAKLGYYQGGFGQLADDMVAFLKSQGVEFVFGEKVNRLINNKAGLLLAGEKERHEADQVLLTTPPDNWRGWHKGLTAYWSSHFAGKVFLGAQTLVLRLKKPLLNQTYWLNINEAGYPFLIVAEHTNFMDKKDYGGEHLVYVGNYLTDKHPFWQKKKEGLLDIFWPFLTKINKDLKKQDVIGVEKFQARFAQPVVGVHYSRQIPPIKTGINGVYVANMFQVYPWDRGINYAVGIGKKAAELILIS